MADVLRWWLAATAMGIAAMPLAYRFFGRLPDRGLAFARPLGLLVIGYALWLAGHLGVTANGPAVALLVAACACAGLWLAGRQRRALLADLRERWGYLVAVEVVFVIVLAGVAWLRAYSPAIEATEKPFESAFFLSILGSPTFPPADPWYAGEPISYYYFGQVPLSVVNHLAGTSPERGFNLALALTGALTAAALFGLVYNLVRGRLGRGRGVLLAAALGPVFFLLVSNLEAVFELLSIQGVDNAALYRALAVPGLEGPNASTSWYPSEFWWWWRATRLGGGWTIQEFPFFSFMLGDLHAHVMVVPYLLTTLAGAAQLWRAGEALTWRWLLRHPFRTVTLALLIGVLYVTNAWDFPTALLIVAVVTLAVNARAGGSADLAWLGHSAGFLAPLAGLSVLLFLPYYLSFEATPTVIEVTRVVSPPRALGVPRGAMATPPVQLFLFWGPLFFPVLSYLVWRFGRLRAWRQGDLAYTAALLATGGPLVLWLTMVARQSGFGAIGEELAGRGHILISWLFLGLVLAGAVLVTVAEAAREGQREGGDSVAPPPSPAPHPRPPGMAFIVATLLTVGIGLIWLAEFFYVREVTVPSRHTTVFKLYFTAWTLLAAGGAAGTGLLVNAWIRGRGEASDAVETVPTTAPGPWQQPAVAGAAALLAVVALVIAFVGRQPVVLVLAVGGVLLTALLLARLAAAAGDGRRPVIGIGAGVWATAALVLIAAALVYPVAAAPSRSEGFAGTPTLDGLASLRQARPDDYAAIMWLRAEIDGQPVVLEASGLDFTDASPVSAYTGLPTVIGWPSHEWLWRGDLPAVEARQADVATIYTSADEGEVRRLLERYDVAYIYLGGEERERYGQSAGQSLAQIGRPVYQNRGVTIFAVDPVPATAPGVEARR